MASLTDFDDIFDGGTDLSFNVQDNIKLSIDSQKEKVYFGGSAKYYLKLKDKIVFSAGVANVIFTPYLLAAHPTWFPAWYTLKALLLIGTRWWTYKALNWHYFLFDFCYFANVLHLLYLHVYPDSKLLFVLCWSFSFGPLAWAIPTWKNSMVFHSLDKITSLFIHLSPPMLMFCLRWNAHDPKYVIPTSDEVSFWYMYLMPLPFYLLWQFMYWLKVYVVSKHKTDRVTSARWLLGPQKGTIYHLSCKPFGKAYADYGFMLMQLTFTLLVLLPCRLFFEYEALNLLFLVIIGGISIWNGAGYLFEVFSARYETELAKEEQKAKEDLIKKKLSKTR